MQTALESTKSTWRIGHHLKLGRDRKTTRENDVPDVLPPPKGELVLPPPNMVLPVLLLPPPNIDPVLELEPKPVVAAN